MPDEQSTGLMDMCFITARRENGDEVMANNVYRAMAKRMLPAKWDTIVASLKELTNYWRICIPSITCVFFSSRIPVHIGKARTGIPRHYISSKRNADITKQLKILCPVLSSLLQAIGYRSPR